MNYTVLVDVDDVVADLLPAWLDLYNAEYDDSLTRENFTDWDMTKFVKPECGKKIYDYLSYPDLYEQVLPIEGSRAGVDTLRRMGNRIIYVSAGVHAFGKYNWLRVYGFEPGDYAENFIVAYDKSMIRGDVLIDDRPKNVETFHSSSILYTQPHNQFFVPNGRVRRADNWADVLRFFS